MLQHATLQFLKDLQKHNNKPWFDRNRYDAAKSDFLQFIDELIPAFGKKDASIASLTARECIFRINRDIRFSKDKTPYKRNLAVSLNKGGKKSVLAGYYFHLEPGNNSFIGGGVWQPMPADLQKVRQEVDYNLKDFKKILNTKNFKTIYGDLSHEEGIALSRVPKGYEVDNPAAEYLKLKSFITMTNISDKELTDKGLLNQTVRAFETIQPLISFLNEALEA
jgi:uncharacterized protein (TIGR02453 family)